MDAILQSFLLDESISEDGRTRPEHMQKFFDNLQKHVKPSKKDAEREFQNIGKTEEPTASAGPNQMA